MWGYEILGGGRAIGELSGYESPCGVMSISSLVLMVSAFVLRIPMWGYEVDGKPFGTIPLIVTNPHVGL